MFQNLSILPKSEIYYMKKSNTLNNLQIQQIYRIDMSMPLIIEQFGEITDDSNFIDYRSSYITSRRRQNLFGMHFKASMVVTDNDTLDHLTDYQ